jgi:hypothetical protein
MRFFVTMLFATLCAGSWNKASAKCGIPMPCRSIHATVLACEIDSESMRIRNMLLADFEERVSKLPESKNRDEQLQEAREAMRRRPFEFKVVARIERVVPLQCEKGSHQMIRYFDMYPVLHDSKKYLAESLGGKRLFSYSGASVFECANLMAAKELSVQMNESWCEWSLPKTKMDLTRIQFAWINTYR